MPTITTQHIPALPERKNNGLEFVIILIFECPLGSNCFKDKIV